MKGPDTDILIVQLRDGRATARAEAARLLVDHPTPHAKANLIRCLSDSDEKVRYWATAALARLDGEDVSRHLAGQLDDPEPSVRMMAARSLSERPHRQVLPKLLEALDDHDENVIYWAQRAIHALGEEIIPSLLECLSSPRWKIRRGAARTLLLFGRRIVPHLARFIEKKRLDEDALFWTLELLGSLKIHAFRNFVESLLESDDSALVCKALSTLGALGDPASIQAVMATLEHRDESVRMAAVEALAAFGDRSVKPICELLDSSRRLLRFSASLVAARLQEVSLKPILERLAADNDEVRYWAVKALDRIGSPALVPLFLELMEDDSFDVQTAAAEALASQKLDEETARSVAAFFRHPDWRMRRAAAEVMEAQTHLGAAFFSPLLHAPDEDTRYWSCRVLRAFPPEQAAPLLVEALEDESWTIRKRAADSLAELGEQAAPLIIEAFRRAPLRSHTRYWLSRAMKGLRSPLLLPLLTELLSDEEHVVRKNATEALEELGEEATAHLLTALRTARSRPLRAALAECLSRIERLDPHRVFSLFHFKDEDLNYWTCELAAAMPPGEALDELEKLLSHHEQRVRMCALRAVARVRHPRSRKILVETLDDESMLLRRIALEGLERQACPEVVPHVIRFLSEDEITMVVPAIRILGSSGSPDAAVYLEEMLKSDRWEIRKESIEALGRCGGGRARRLLSRLLREELRCGSDLLPFIIEAIGRCGGEGTEDELLAVLDHIRDEALLCTSIRALASCGSRKAAERLMEMAAESRDWEITKVLLEALLQLPPVKAEERFKQRVVRSRDPMIRNLGRRVLRRSLGEEAWDEYVRRSMRRTLEEPAAELYRNALQARNEGRTEEAARLARRAVRLRKRSEYYALLASLHLSRGNLAAARANVKKALTLTPSDPAALCQLAACHLAAGRRHKALEIFKRILARGDLPAPLRKMAAQAAARIEEELEGV